ncbi:RNA recognition motif domain-containing protein [Anabaena azotica]|uniref:RNA-binding protein n=1 Tax=Anabaena azotica FACHB-119 TaxID=947527 RepID=A0ABR8DI07_9NOST|nr:RNA-binding protein [Anabaena azotica]MBD2505403.1 RNA-binding protein [Anabaena azotica FACHB-119]
MSVYVTNLSGEMKYKELQQIFSKYGNVKTVQLSMNQETGKPRGFAFLEMETFAQETLAMKALLGSEWIVRILKVNTPVTSSEASSASCDFSSTH